MNIKEIKKYIKPIFLSLVVILVIYEFHKILADISYNDVRGIVDSVSKKRLAGMAAICMFATVFATSNDFVMTKMLGTNKTFLDIFLSSYSINSINGVIGFSGLVSTGLRTQLFSKGKGAKKVVAISTEEFLIFLLALSFMSIFGIIYIAFHPASFLRKYWMWFFGTSLISICALFLKDIIVGKINKISAIKGHENRVQLFICSLLEWTGLLISFTLVGKLMGIEFKFFEVFFVTMLGFIIGIVSMMPGSFGTFDVFVTIALCKIGISKDLIITWLLIFRIFYHIIPFIIGCIIMTYVQYKEHIKENNKLLA